jgi:RimJ/RimL family protein N-acetyltransferase
MKDENGFDSGFDVTLHGDGFLLRPWKPEDARWYVESRDEDVFRWTKEKRDLTVREAEEGIRQANSNPDAVCLAIVDNRSRELVGNIAMAFREDSRKSAEIMYWLAPRGRGRGIATDSVKLLCRWAFNSLGLERVTLKTPVGNVRSQKVAERAGFHRQDNKNEGGANAGGVWFDEYVKNAGTDEPGGSGLTTDSE